MKINLIAVQPKMELADYASFAAFEAKVALLMQTAMRSVDTALPTLVAFPEYLGMYLGFVPYHWDEIRSETTTVAAIDRIATSAGGRGERPSRADLQRLLFVEHALETEQAYMSVFSSLARQHHAYLVAGSLCVPAIDESPHRGGRFIRAADRVYNQSYLFSPAGLCVGRVAKVNIPPGEDSLIDGSADELTPIRTRMGRIGILLCWDGYHHRPIEHYDSLGVDILVQPAYFGSPAVRFDGSGEVVPRPWDFVSMIQGRESIQYGVGAFMVGAVFADKRAEGLSFIARNSGQAGGAWEDAVVARTSDPYAEAIVSAAVELKR